MKTLYLVRHAKAGDHSERRDFERELTESGERDAVTVAKALDDKKVLVDLILASPAARTLATARLIAHGIHYSDTSIGTDRRIYNAEEKMLLKVLQQIDDQYQSVIMVGHNPGVTELANNIFNLMITSMPTAGVVAGILDVDSWSEIRGDGKLLFQIQP